MPKKSTLTAALILLSAASAACAGPDQNAQSTGEGGTAPEANLGQIELWKFQLMRDDMAFGNLTTIERAQGWMDFMSDSGTVITRERGELRGRNAFRPAIEELFADPTYRFFRAPERSEVANSGDLGYTVGRYRVDRRDSTGATVSETGKYVTIWRRQPDGKWKVEMHLGTPVDVPLPSPTGLPERPGDTSN